MTREQFIANVRTEQEGLRRFLLALCGDIQQADDLAQDALVKAYIASDSYKARFKFSTWLYKIGYNCFIDSIRKRGNLQKVGEDAAQDKTADESADSAFRYQGLYLAIDGLSPGEKAAILLFYLEDRPVKEISSILNIPQGTVRSQLSRGREHLKQLIER